MSNIIALVWDFDKTLISEYMQTPIFKEYGINPKTFWDEVNSYSKQCDILPPSILRIEAGASHSIYLMV